MQLVAGGFGIAKEGLAKGSLLQRISDFVIAQHRNGKRALLIVDEAQNLSFEALEELRDPDMEVLMLDSTNVRAHQHAAGAESTTPEQEALGRSRGGFTTKIHVAVDGVGKPTKILLTPGQEHDVTKGPELIQGSEADRVIADKGYDSDRFVEQIEAQGATAVIPPRENRKEPRDYDRDEYKKRNVVERFINTLKQSRRVATRYEKTARNFLGFVLFASTLVMLNLT